MWNYKISLHRNIITAVHSAVGCRLQWVSLPCTICVMSNQNMVFSPAGNKSGPAQGFDTNNKHMGSPWETRHPGGFSLSCEESRIFVVVIIIWWFGCYSFVLWSFVSENLKLNCRSSHFTYIKLLPVFLCCDTLISIYLLTAVGLSPGGSTHFHTNNT
jgi:hypothetical protein